MSLEQFDIVIVGGGLVGATCAGAIRALEAQVKSDKPLKIAIIDSQSVNPTQTRIQSTSFDGKAIALSYGSALLLNKWQLWSDIKPCVESIKKIEVSEQGSAGFNFMHKPVNQSALGFVVEAQQMGQAVLNNLSQKQIDWLCPVKIKHLAQHQNHIELTLDNHQSIQTKLLLACDGANSQVRQILNLEHQVEDYQQWAITANIEMNQKHGNIAYERFTREGPLAMLPMTDNRFGLVWCASEQHIQDLLALSDDEFIKALQANAGYKAGKVIRCGARQAYPLSRRYNLQNISHRAVLLGNASHTVHPIAGQGLNLGIRDIYSVARQVIQKTLQQEDIGLGWQSYQTERNSDIQLILQATDTLVKTFSNDQPLLKFARNAGLLALELNPLLKQIFSQRAMGLLNNKNRLNA